ncbi:hypothetical protein V8E36_003447 [Tilletia maclaganii]
MALVTLEIHAEARENFQLGLVFEPDNPARRHLRATTNTVTIFGGLTWIGITSTHVRFRKALAAQGVPLDTLPYRAPFQPYLSWFAIGFTSIVLLFKGFDAFTPTFQYKSFITNYIGLPIFFFSWLGYKLIYKSKVVPLDLVDLQTGVRNYDGQEEDEDDIERKKAKTVKEKVVYYIKNW